MTSKESTTNYQTIWWKPTAVMTLIPSLTFTQLQVVSREHLQWVWHASRDRLPFRTPGSIPLFGTCLCSNCWDQISRTCLFFSRLFTLNIPRYFLNFAFTFVESDLTTFTELLMFVMFWLQLKAQYDCENIEVFYIDADGDYVSTMLSEWRDSFFLYNCNSFCSSL